jgi:DNA modification methylase
MTVNRLILGDNLEILKAMESESVDLIYLDPPFFSNRNYEVIWGDTGEIRSFQDRWAGGVGHYIDWLRERVVEMHRVLMPTGSIFLHCDWHANAYIRVHILDRIFGEDNFREEIIWKRQTAKKGSQFEKRTFGSSIDTIFWFSKTNAYTFVIPKVQLEDEAMLKKFNKTDIDGRKFRIDHIELIETMARKNLIYEYNGYTPKYGWMVNKEKLKQFDVENRLYWSNTGKPYRKYFADEYEGIEITNLWNDIYIAAGKERIGYPTQKPEALLERVIKCASSEGDVVLDPFMGGGTTIAVANKLNRQWIGIDQSPMAVKVTELRLQKQTDFFTAPYTTQLHKYDYDTLRFKDAFEFESWIVAQFGGTGNVKQRGDLGLDGKTGDNTPIQVKRSDNVSRNVIDNFKSAAERYDNSLFIKNQKAEKPIGYIIAFSFGKGAVEEVARLKNEQNIIIKLVKVEDIVPIAVKPVIGVHISELERDDKGNRKIEFTAQGQSPAGIEFYSWDFAHDEAKNFKPSVIIDKTGKQVLTLKTGEHVIAVKVVDNEGLENTEIVRLKINGAVERGKR